MRTTARRNRSAALLATLALLVAACGGDDDASSSDGEPAPAETGELGEVEATEDGSLIVHAAPGAEAITVERTDSGWSLEPDGASFDPALLVVVTFDRGDLEVPVVELRSSDGSVEMPRQMVTVDDDRVQAIVLVEHFTDMVPVDFTASTTTHGRSFSLGAVRALSGLPADVGNDQPMSTENQRLLREYVSDTLEHFSRRWQQAPDDPWPSPEIFVCSPCRYVAAPGRLGLEEGQWEAAADPADDDSVDMNLDKYIALPLNTSNYQSVPTDGPAGAGSSSETILETTLHVVSSPDGIAFLVPVPDLESALDPTAAAGNGTIEFYAAGSAGSLLFQRSSPGWYENGKLVQPTGGPETVCVRESCIEATPFLGEMPDDGDFPAGAFFGLLVERSDEDRGDHGVLVRGSGELEIVSLGFGDEAGHVFSANVTGEGLALLVSELDKF